MAAERSQKMEEFVVLMLHPEDRKRWEALSGELDEVTRKAVENHPHLAVWMLAERDLAQKAYARALSVVDRPDFLNEVAECLFCKAWLAIHPELQILHDLLQIKYRDGEALHREMKRVRRMIRARPETREEVKALLGILQSTTDPAR